MDLSFPPPLSEFCTYLYLSKTKLTCSVMNGTVSSYIHCPNWQPGGHPRQTSPPAPCSPSMYYIPKELPSGPTDLEQEKNSGCFKPASMRWLLMQQWITTTLITSKRNQPPMEQNVSLPIGSWVSGSSQLSKPLLATLLKTTPSFSLADLLRALNMV